VSHDDPAVLAVALSLFDPDGVDTPFQKVGSVLLARLVGIILVRHRVLRLLC